MGETLRDRIESLSFLDVNTEDGLGGRMVALDAVRVAVSAPDAYGLFYRLGPFPNALDAARSMHQRSDTIDPMDVVTTACRTCYIFDEGWPCTVARLIAVVDEQLVAEAETRR